ncbi:hypothetical protein [Escherichia coli]|uniref:hypothetical protein n=1 Tax=Escherichia coli TaxID=562 RepID=UPI003CE55A58
MESNIKWLVAAGHEMASELKAECGAVDMRSVAKLISDLATQLEVQLVRANALAEDQQKAIESIKQADAAVKLAHEKFSALAAENAGLKAANGIALQILNDEETMVTSLWVSSVQKVEVNAPTTDAILAEVRAKGVEMFGKWLRDSADIFDKNSRHDWADQNRVHADKAAEFAAQLRQGGAA